MAEYDDDYDDELRRRMNEETMRSRSKPISSEPFSASTTMSARNALGMWGGLIMACIGIGSACYGLGTVCHFANPMDALWVGVGLTIGVFNLAYAIGIAIKAEGITYK